MSANYQTTIQQFAHQNILVIGDLMLDVYLQGTSSRISREAPVPIVNIHTRENMPGGAANAAVNVAMLGAKTTFITVVGQDHAARVVTTLLEQAGVNTRGVLSDPDRETICKKRVLSDGQLLVRYDYGSIGPIAPRYEKQTIERLIRLFPQMDAILISDYGYGVITDTVIAALAPLQREHHKLIVVDSAHLKRFRDLKPAAVKPNYQEAIHLLDLAPADDGCRVEQILANGQAILDITAADIASITIDSEGAVIFERDKPPYRTYAKEVPDSKAAGAGDTYIGALTIALSLGLRPLDAAELASAASSVVVNKHGTATCSASELKELFTPPQKVVRDWQELAERLRAYREQGRRIVFTNGCFDILHLGHISYLSQAKQLGDLLIIGVNSDESVRRLKGPARPINPLDDRMEVLAALDIVDHVVSFHEDTPIELIKIVQPDVFVKGGDYTKASLPEASVVEELGGVVEILPYMQDRSTTNVIQKIQSQAG